MFCNGYALNLIWKLIPMSAPMGRQFLGGLLDLRLHTPWPAAVLPGDDNT